MEKLGVTIILQFYQWNGKSPLTWLKQSNYPVITIYAAANEKKDAKLNISSDNLF